MLRCAFFGRRDFFEITVLFFSPTAPDMTRTPATTYEEAPINAPSWLFRRAARDKAKDPCLQLLAFNNRRFFGGKNMPGAFEAAASAKAPDSQGILGAPCAD